MELILYILIGIIVFFQFKLYAKTNKLIKKLKRVLSHKFSLYDDEDDEEEATMIVCEREEEDELTQSIQNSINIYLLRNKGAVSDFNLIKDIVERNCDSLEEEISSQTPLPLYLGLMGTVLGIVLGLGMVSQQTDFAKDIDLFTTRLMKEVAVAMIASFVGILLTTLSLWNSKKCKSIVEANKNKFYTWFQTHLLPIISRSAVSAITLLQQNLTRFNSTFQNTIARLENSLGEVGDVYESQIEILEKIERIDVNRLASANVRILSTLEGSIGQIERLSRYMTSVTEYLENVRALNDKIDEHLERTEMFGVVTEFYRSQMSEIQARHEAIRTTVIGVDDVIQRALTDLKSRTEHVVAQIGETFVNQQASIERMVAENTAQIGSKVNMLPKIVSDLEKVPSQLAKVAERIEKSNEALGRKIVAAVNSRQPGRASSSQSFGPKEPSTPMWMKWSILAGISVLALTSVINLCVSLSGDDNDSQKVDQVEELDKNTTKSKGEGKTANEIVDTTANNPVEFDSVGGSVRQQDSTQN